MTACIFAQTAWGAQDEQRGYFWPSTLLEPAWGLENDTADFFGTGEFEEDSGDDPTAMELMLAGGHGNISVTANIAPAVMAQMCRRAMAGDRAGAAALDEQLSPLNRALFVEPNPIPVKWALQHRGLIEGGIRLPLTILDESFCEQVIAALEAAGV